MGNIKVKISRHAKRRMKLYDISENDVYRVIDQGKRGSTEDGKTIFLGDFSNKFKYPLKVVAVWQDDLLLVVTAYPLKKGGKNEN
ncbi:MAG: DUF4258 domain-containing protein [Deltaproteobacteria bacterium]|nr:DUF4258 domain-containing protein [Deltaproteobacteria bacterium]